MHRTTHATWLQWNQTASTGNLVSAWNDPLSVTEATDSAVTYYWNSWVQAQEETAEQRAQHRRWQAELDQRARDYAAVRKAAAERAERLLEACLTSSQRESLRKQGWFVVFTMLAQKLMLETQEDEFLRLANVS
jgi:hypothetical protein